MWVIFSLTFIKLVIFHLFRSFYQIGIWWYERGACHLRFNWMVTFSLGHRFLFDVNDILIHFEWFGCLRLAVPDRWQLWVLKTSIKETLDWSIRDLRWVIILVDLGREKGVFNLLIVELLHFKVTLCLLVCKKLIIQESKS